MTTSEINNYDVQLIKYLSRGISQENIETVFKEYSPNSKVLLKNISINSKYFQVNNTIHLVAIAKVGNYLRFHSWQP
jgi:hypothetical protein